MIRFLRDGSYGREVSRIVFSFYAKRKYERKGDGKEKGIRYSAFAESFG